MSFPRLGQSARRLDKLLSEIAVASGEQLAGIMLINSCVAELNNLTQQNAANAEEMAASVHETAAQVKSLSAIVWRYTAQNQSSPHITLAA
ncbi:MAG: hypothetical protein Phyf2KO_02110 [Phycisphaerales bacterium]